MHGVKAEPAPRVAFGEPRASFSLELQRKPASLAQLGLNVLWSFLFFAARSPGLGLIDIVPQWLLIAATIALFQPLDRPAAACLVPPAAWVAFASLLNFEIWRLN